MPAATAATADLLLQLQTTLEIQDLLCLFSEGVQSFVPHSGLRYRHSSNDLKVGVWEDGSYHCRKVLVLVDEDLGELVLSRSEPFSGEDSRRFDSFIHLLLHPLRNALRYSCAMENAHRDPLTGLGNRRALDATLARDLQLARRRGSPLSVLMLDLDRFKMINDRYGHAVGDCLLRHFSRILSETVRSSDLCFRYGGEEFAVIMPDTDSNSANTLAERIRQAVMLPHCCGGHPLQMTVSIGVTSLTDKDNERTLLGRADQALYQAKRLGRNRTHLANPAGTSSIDTAPKCS
ncbi:GGDEF domain-containing protein [Thiohalomonas denitrificans]|nr:GGDEF domain-containing protein [Thiohalomonas denitrificans]